jgi:hypothetical protein
MQNHTIDLKQNTDLKALLWYLKTSKNILQILSIILAPTPNPASYDLCLVSSMRYYFTANVFLKYNFLRE